MEREMPIQLRSVGERELRMLEDGHQAMDEEVHA
ncbi:hypothetical protein PIIN_11140 [Serendipita indica DSM 11827]|uniref:Uncharacterized protein n=1 Tax=Serendipita indica (strain DSM 11827) TaxID=1109443 RepID=G4U0R5_SERID|nr:hypothetical protein PIIN_11140 [Serendipita indica DSM 11827]